jgi:hypothetical protein
MKFGILALAFYGDRTLKRMISNTGGFVDKIYISHSPIPWNQYNDKARDKYKSTFDIMSISNFPFREKIELISDIWPSEEAQRNDALKKARTDGIDYLIIQDADEFYLPEDFQKNLEGIRNNPHHPAYRCPWTVFWKTTNYVIQVREHKGKPRQTVTTCPNFAVNVNWPGIQFSNCRLVNEMDQACMLEGLCLHLAWVLSDSEVQQKISTWGHSHQFNTQKWYKHKWLAWQPKTRFIGHINRYNYIQAVTYKGALPSELNGLSAGLQNYRPLSFFEKLDCFVIDLISIVYVKLSKFKYTFLSKNFKIKYLK